MRRFNIKRLFLIYLTVLFTAGFIIPEDLLARRGFGGGRSFRSSRSSSWGSKSRSKSAWGSKPKKMSNQRGSGSMKKSGSSKADKQLYQKAKAKGTTFKNRDAAKSDFQKNHGNKYQSKYTSKPTTRPKHIPKSTTVDGKNYNVNYNQQYGGYGYLGPGGGWMAYSVMRDAAMLSILMSSHSYYYGAAPHYGGGFGISRGFVLIVIIIILAIIFKPRL